MEVVRTTAAEEDVVRSGTDKRRKVGDGELRLTSSVFVESETHGQSVAENFVNLTEEEDSSNLPSSVAAVTVGFCCSGNGSTEMLKIADLEEEESVEFGTEASHNSDRRESAQPSEIMAESSELGSTITSNPSPAPAMFNSRRTISTEKKPPAAEIEEFFAAAEKDLHNRFKDKYNFDIVNDVPLKGRFGWTQLKP